MFWSVEVYPRKRPVKSCLSSLDHQTPVRFTQTRMPKSFRYFRLGLTPHQPSKGVIPVLEWTQRLWRYAACRRADNQYFGSSAAPYRRARVVTAKILFHFFGLSVLGWAISASRFDLVSELSKHHVDKSMRPGKFPALVAPNESTFFASECLKEESYYFQRW
jgi:hypothetical protein